MGVIQSSCYCCVLPTKNKKGEEGRRWCVNTALNLMGLLGLSQRPRGYGGGAQVLRRVLRLLWWLSLGDNDKGCERCGGCGCGGCSEVVVDNVSVGYRLLLMVIRAVYNNEHIDHVVTDPQ